MRKAMNVVIIWKSIWRWGQNSELSDRVQSGPSMPGHTWVGGRPLYLLADSRITSPLPAHSQPRMTGWATLLQTHLYGGHFYSTAAAFAINSRAFINVDCIVFLELRG